MTASELVTAVLGIKVRTPKLTSELPQHECDYPVTSGPSVTAYDRGVSIDVITPSTADEYEAYYASDNADIAGATKIPGLGDRAYFTVFRSSPVKFTVHAFKGTTHVIVSTTAGVERTKQLVERLLT